MSIFKHDIVKLLSYGLLIGAGVSTAILAASYVQGYLG